MRRNLIPACNAALCPGHDVGRNVFFCTCNHTQLGCYGVLTQPGVHLNEMLKNVNQYFPKAKVMSSNCFVPNNSPQSKEIQFTVTEEFINQKISTSKKLESENLYILSFLKNASKWLIIKIVIHLLSINRIFVEDLV